ncbi:hypothetical protein A1O3_10439, partial [Capronia epimyces CBS 606.96]
MSAPNDTNGDAGWKANGRPQSTLARDFSATLDDLFKLNGVGALEESVEQKKDTLQSQRYQLENLDAKLRETDEKLRTLESKHHRHVEISSTSRRRPVSSIFPGENDADYSSGDSDAQKSSPAREVES